MEKYLTHTTDLIGNGFGTINNEVVQGLTFGYNQAQTLVVHVYSVLVEQQLILGFQMLITGLLYVVMAILATYVFRRIWKLSKVDIWDKSVVMIAAATFGAWSVVNGITMIIGSLPYIINPQYYALQESLQILNRLK